MKVIIRISCLLFLLQSLPGISQVKRDTVLAEEPIGMTTQQFNERIKIAQKPLLVYFSADWCTVCKRQRPLLEQILAENNKQVELLVIDMDSNPLIAAYFEVDALPVNMMYRDGSLVWDRVGFQEKQKILDYLTLLIHKK